MLKYLLAFIAFSICLAVISAGPAKRAAAKKVPVKTTPKMTCMVCQGAGDNCKSSKTESNCDKCAKFTGVADDPKKVPEYVWKMMPSGAKEGMSHNKGKKMTVRGCATQEMIDVATMGDTYEEFGCSDFDEMFGFKDATGCLCKGDCE